MSIEASAADAGLAPVRSILQSDGGDIELLSVESDTVVLRLIVDDANCAECVLPREMLEMVALDLMKPLVPGLMNVLIEDPREVAG
jgi:Fe-S cluster biogenesis protein NfuA